jgi:hypothetical protein
MSSSADAMMCFVLSVPTVLIREWPEMEIRPFFVAIEQTTSLVKCDSGDVW